MAAFVDPGNPAGRPSWRKAGRDEGFRITGRRGRQWDVRRVSRHVGQVWVPKAGCGGVRWLRAGPIPRWGLPVPTMDARAAGGAQSDGVTMDRGNGASWHEIAVRMSRSGSGRIRSRPVPSGVDASARSVGTGRGGGAVSAALSTGELLHCPALTGRERIRLRLRQRTLARPRGASDPSRAPGQARDRPAVRLRRREHEWLRWS